VLLECGDLEAAADQARRAAVLARETGGGEAAAAQAILTVALLQAGHVEEALAESASALTSLGDGDGLEVEEKVHYARALAEHAAGLTDAVGHLERARAVVNERAATLDPELQARYVSGNAWHRRLMGDQPFLFAETNRQAPPIV
jgi:hypothetical protein